MSSLTVCSFKATKASQCLRKIACRRLHTSSSCKKNSSNTRSSSRTRLTKDLKPSLKSGRLEVAPKPLNGSSEFSDGKGRQKNGGTAPVQATDTISPWAHATAAKIRSGIPMFNELYNPPSPVTFASSHTNNDTPHVPVSQLHTRFTSPPLMSGFVTCLADMLGPNPNPTPIQALSIKWLIEDDSQDSSSSSSWKQFLLASETGSGKSIAYLLPVLQHLKWSEMQGRSTLANSDLQLNPRALILSPTHELSRQLSGFAKKLLHEVKLRVLCVSRANVKNIRERDASSKRMQSQLEMFSSTSGAPENAEVKKIDIPIDVVVGTPMKLLELARGRGWDRDEAEEHHVMKENSASARFPAFSKGKPEIGLTNVEWVVVDEADVLFDPDFQEYTRMLLADISASRGVPVPYSSESLLSASSITNTNKPKDIDSSDTQALNYPFNLILSTATIPSALTSYLDKHHPNLIRLASPNLHHLPKTLKTEFVAWSGGNKFADIERRIRQVWADDAVAAMSGVPPSLSKVLIFCNKNIKVAELGAYLAQRGIKNVALTSMSEERRLGSNKHLEGFLRPLSAKEKQELHDTKEVAPSVQDEPHVMITTSLLSRGLDFSPELRHVFIVDEPRNMIDFLHRAGRSGRAGQKGKVVIFGKVKGRGSAQAKEVRKRVGALAA